MCDLWVNTLDAAVPRGAIARQIRDALATLPPARQIKLYNAGSFFDPQAIPVDDYEEIAAAVAGFDRVIVESHPGLPARAPRRRVPALSRSRSAAGSKWPWGSRPRTARRWRRSTSG